VEGDVVGGPASQRVAGGLGSWQATPTCWVAGRLASLAVPTPLTNRLLTSTAPTSTLPHHTAQHVS